MKRRIVAWLARGRASTLRSARRQLAGYGRIFAERVGVCPACGLLSWAGHRVAIVAYKRACNVGRPTLAEWLQGNSWQSVIAESDPFEPVDLYVVSAVWCPISSRIALVLEWSPQELDAANLVLEAQTLEVESGSALQRAIPAVRWRNVS